MLRLSRLRILDFERNQLTTLPDEMLNLTRLTELTLDHNPMRSPPLEVCCRGLDIVRQYVKAARVQGTEPCMLARWLLLGYGGAGKSTLLSALKGGMNRQRIESTDGIDVEPIKVPGSAAQPSAKALVWDFAGQEVYYHTHEYFLPNSERTVFLLMFDCTAKPGCTALDRTRELDFWLAKIKSHCPNARVLVVGTRASVPIANIFTSGLIDELNAARKVGTASAL